MSQPARLAALGAGAILAGGVTLAPPCAAAGDRELGAYLASECVTCHQTSRVVGGVPAIVGWPEDQFVAVMKSYRARERDNPVMQTVAAKLSEEEMQALAAHFGSIGPPTAAN